MTTARANNLAHTMPFIDAADIMAAVQRYPPQAPADLYIQYGDTSASMMCTILGPLASESLYVVNAVGVAYTLPATELIRFLRAADRQRVRRPLKRQRA